MFSEALSDKAKGIFPKLIHFNDFCLAGGTALALQIRHRMSVDFDLFSEKDIPDNLFDKVKKTFSGCSLSLSVSNPGELTVFIEEIKTTFLRYPFPILSEIIDYEGVKLLSVKEIAATKAYTIGRRGSYKDYVDLYFIIAGKYASLDEIIDLAEKKYGGEFNSRLFLEQLVYLGDIEDIEIVFLGRKISKAEAEGFFKEAISRIRL
jgi:hypothetical protein